MINQTFFHHTKKNQSEYTSNDVIAKQSLSRLVQSTYRPFESFRYTSLSRACWVSPLSSKPDLQNWSIARLTNAGSLERRDS